MNRNDGGITGPAGQDAVTDKSISVALVQPFASTVLGAATMYSVIYYIPADVTEIEFQLGFRELLTPAGVGSPVANISIAGGEPTVDRQAFVGTPAQATITVPAFQLSAKVTMPVARDANGYMMFRYQVPAGTAYIEYVTNAGQGGYCWSQAGTNVLLGSGWSTTAAPAGNVVIHYETTAPRLVIWSDSIQRGVAGTDQCGLLNSMARLGPNRAYAVACNGVASTLFSTWANMSNWMLGTTSKVQGCTVWIALGTNDIAAGETATNLIQYCRKLCRDAYAQGAKKLIVSTIPPSSAYSAPQRAQLDLFNAWAQSLPGTFDVLLDLWTLLKDPNNSNQLLAAYAATGGIHITTAAMDVIEDNFVEVT